MSSIEHGSIEVDADDVVTHDRCRDCDAASAYSEFENPIRPICRWRSGRTPIHLQVPLRRRCRNARPNERSP